MEIQMSDFEDTAAPFREIILRKDTLIRKLESQLDTCKAEVERLKSDIAEHINLVMDHPEDCGCPYCRVIV